MTHAWTKFTEQGVDVIVAPDGSPFGVDRPDEPIGEMVACSDCGCLLEAEALNQPCIPLPVEL